MVRMDRSSPVTRKNPWRSSAELSHVPYWQQLFRHLFTGGYAKKRWRDRVAISRMGASICAGALFEVAPIGVALVLLVVCVVLPGIQIPDPKPALTPYDIVALTGMDVDDQMYQEPMDVPHGMSPVQSQPCDGRTHEVRNGESLARIARRYHVPWNKIVQANKAMDDPNVLQVNDLVCVPRV